MESESLRVHNPCLRQDAPKSRQRSLGGEGLVLEVGDPGLVPDGREEEAGEGKDPELEGLVLQAECVSLHEQNRAKLRTTDSGHKNSLSLSKLVGF